MSGLTEVLAAHQWHHTRQTHCACGFRTPLAQLAFDGYAEHVAKQVTAWLSEQLGSAEVRDAVVDQLHMLSAIPREPTHEETATAAIHAVTEWLTGGAA